MFAKPNSWYFKPSYVQKDPHRSLYAVVIDNRVVYHVDELDLERELDLLEDNDYIAQNTIRVCHVHKHISCLSMDRYEKLTAA